MLHFPESLQHVGKLVNRGSGTQDLAMWFRPVAGNKRVRRHIAHNARASAKDGVLADLHLLSNSRLAADNRARAELNATSKTNLRDDNTVLADLTVVRDMHEIIDLCAIANPGGAGAARSIVTLDPISTSSPITTCPICGTLR